MEKEKLIELRNEITFVTSNKGKVASAQKYFKDIKLEICDRELIEPRSDDIKEIAESKVRQAFEMVNKPCIALDAGFFIEELNGFPRAYVNFALDTLGINGILKQMENVENRKCSFKEYLAYFDGENLLYFYGNNEGTLSNEVRGIDNIHKWSDLWYIFIPHGYSKTLAELSDEERLKRIVCDQNKSAMQEFAAYYNKAKSLVK